MSDSITSANMYFLTVSVLPQKEGVDLAGFIHKLGKIIVDHSPGIAVVYEFKVLGEPRLVFVVSVSRASGLEAAVGALWLQGGVVVECQPVVTYESFARSIKVSEDLAQPSWKGLAKENLYWLEFDVDYHGKSTEKIIKIWKKEAEAVFAARLKGGALLELYKCVAQRKVHAFMNVASPGYLDALSLQLPLMYENGANVQLKCKAVQFLEDYISYVDSD